MCACVCVCVRVRVCVYVRLCARACVRARGQPIYHSQLSVEGLREACGCAIMPLMVRACARAAVLRVPAWGGRAVGARIGVRARRRRRRAGRRGSCRSVRGGGARRVPVRWWNAYPYERPRARRVPVRPLAACLPPTTSTIACVFVRLLAAVNRVPPPRAGRSGRWGRWQRRRRRRARRGHRGRGAHDLPRERAVPEL